MIVCPSCNAHYEEADSRFCGRCGSDMGQLRAVLATDGRGDLLIGRVIDGRYRVLERLGQGGMGAVYRVEHLAMGKQAAMKVLHPTLTQDAELDARFHREAEAVSRLSHPNAVQVFDFGRGQGLVYLVMELVRGEDLGSVLRRDGPMAWSQARLLLIQICDALAEAHEAGIVHRDLKPENLLLSRTRDGRPLVKVLDFGLAKLRDREETNQVTARGSLLGTPYYMSPEQIRAEDLDGRSDIYSLGALLYRMVTGEPPFAGATPVAVLTQHLGDPLILPTIRRPDLKLDPVIDRIVARAMAKSRDERYPTADAMRQALIEAQLEGPVAPTLPEEASLSLGRSGVRRLSDQSADPQFDTTLHAGASATPSGAQPLRREDLDAYERSLRRRRWAGLAVFPLLILAAGGGLAIYRARTAPRPVDEEVEPNNSPADANLIAAWRIVHGHIGRALGAEESDRDYYRFSIRPQKAPALLHVDLTGIPNIDLKLQVFDSRGERIAESDDAGAGDGEDLPNVRLPRAGEYYIAVREVWVQGQPAQADDQNEYTLTARWHPLSPGEESEPDDRPAEAIALSPGQPIRGYAGRAGDVDYYLPVGAGGGTLRGSLSAIPGVDLRLVVLPPGAQSGPPGALPAGAQVFDGGGLGEAETFEAISWPAGAPAPLIVVERKERSAPAEPREKGRGSKLVAKTKGDVAEATVENPLVGLDIPYSLNVRPGG